MAVPRREACMGGVIMDTADPMPRAVAANAIVSKDTYGDEADSSSVGAEAGRNNRRRHKHGERRVLLRRPKLVKAADVKEKTMVLESASGARTNSRSSSQFMH